jgi:hypothetical protein
VNKTGDDMAVIEKRGRNGRVIDFFGVILCLDFEQELL